MRVFALVLVCLSMIVPVAASAPVLVVKDPSGDALAAGVAPSPTHGWADVTKAEIEETSDEAFTLRLFVGATGPEYVDGVVVLNFLVGDQWYFMGYGALIFPGGRYVGGFYCPSDENGQPTGECPNLEGSFANGVFTIPDVPRANFGLDTPGATMDRPWLESGNHVLATVWLRADRSDEGEPFVFQRGAPIATSKEENRTEEPELPASAASTVTDHVPRARSPSLGGVGVVFLVAVLCAALRRR